MIHTVHLHGHLAEQFGSTYRFDVATAGEALRALHVNFKGFADTLKEGSYEIVSGNYDETGLGLDYPDLNDFHLGKNDLHIVPIIAGSKERGGFLKVLLGALIVGAAIFLSGGVLGAAVGTGMIGSAVTWGNIAAIGVSLMLAGISRMMSPSDEPTAKDEGYSISGPGNTYSQGSPVPLIYGEVITGSVMISAGLDIEDMAIASAGTGTGQQSNQQTQQQNQHDHDHNGGPRTNGFY